MPKRKCSTASRPVSTAATIDTSISTDIVIYGALMLMSAMAIVVLVVSNKKRA
jgi:hypothetical protein